MALLMESSLAASDLRMTSDFSASALFMRACLSPSDSSTCALLRRSASAFSAADKPLSGWVQRMRLSVCSVARQL